MKANGSQFGRSSSDCYQELLRAYSRSQDSTVLARGGKGELVDVEVFAGAARLVVRVLPQSDGFQGLNHLVRNLSAVKIPRASGWENTKVMWGLVQ